MQARIARSGDRSPTAAALVHEDDVVEAVDRFQTHDERRIAVLLHDHGARNRGLETMGGVVADDAAKRTQQRSAWRRLGVVRERVQEGLYRRRRSKAIDDAPFSPSESCPERSRRGHGW